MKKRLLLPVGLIVALVVPSIAFGAVVTFTGSFPNDSNATISFDVKRVNGKNTRVINLSVRRFNVHCTKTGNHEIKTETGNPISIDKPVLQRHWNYNDGVTHFEGTFRKANKNKADGTLEVTLAGTNLFGPTEYCHGGPREFHAHT
jgi:hypothetical protein